MQEKLLLFILTMANACNYNGVPELSLALLFSALHANPHTTTTLHTLLKNEISKSLLPEGALRALPSRSTYSIQLQ
jgi:hypothetical protein